MIDKSTEIEKNATDKDALDVTTKNKIYTHPAFIAAAFVLAVVLVFIIIIAIVTSTRGISVAELFGIKGKRLDFKNDDLYEYIDINEDDYKGYEIKIDIPKPSDIDVDNHIINLIYKNIKQSTDLIFKEYQYTTPESTNTISVGDKVFLYYAGYFLDENGNRIEIPALTNYAIGNEDGYYTEKEKPDSIFIGENSNMFAPGFELSLIGLPTIKKASADDHNNVFDAKLNGKVMEGEVVYLCVTYIDEFGILHNRENVRIDLRDEKVEEVWGEGIYDILRETTLGQSYETRADLTTSIGKRIYTYFRINYTTSCETKDNIETIKVIYPYDWSEETLQGKTVYFDVFLEKSLKYKTSEFNDAFITDVVKMTSEDLSSFSGDSLTEKYKAYYMSKLIEEYEDTCQSLAEELVWERVKENATLIELPEDEYVAAYNIRYNSYKEEYEKFQQGDNPYYEDIDEYIAECFGLGKEDDVGEVLRADVKDGIYEKLIVFAFLRAEDLLPKNDEEYDVIYKHELSLDYDYYLDGCKKRGEEPEYKTMEEYDTFINSYYGKDGYEDFVYYSYATSKMLEMITIVYE